MTSLSNLFKFNDLVLLFKMRKLTVFKTQNFKKQKMLCIPILPPAHLEKKNMAKYKCFVWKESNTCLLSLGVMSVPHG